MSPRLSAVRETWQGRHGGCETFTIMNHHQLMYTVLGNTGLSLCQGLFCISLLRSFLHYIRSFFNPSDSLLHLVQPVLRSGRNLATPSRIVKLSITNVLFVVINYSSLYGREKQHRVTFAWTCSRKFTPGQSVTSSSRETKLFWGMSLAGGGEGERKQESVDTQDKGFPSSTRLLI